MNNRREFNLDLLTEFPGALVYGFEPEGDGNYEFKSLYPQLSQFGDVLDAYLYAQDHILPTIQEKGLFSIDESQWIDWIKETHRKIGRHLIEHLNHKSG